MAQAIAEMSDGLAMFGPDGRVVFCNDHYRALFQISLRPQSAHITEIVRASVRNGEHGICPSISTKMASKLLAKRSSSIRTKSSHSQMVAGCP